MLSILLTTLQLITLPSSALASSQWLVRASDKALLQNISGCQSSVLNPHLGGDIFKLQCHDPVSLSGLSPVANVHFEEESSWGIFTPLNLNFIGTSDPLVGDQWALEQINIESFWDKQSRGSTQTRVAIIDTGVDYEHEDLHTQIAVNTNEIPGNNIDDDNNGYVDDVFGWNAYENTGNAMDFHHHGTHIAGIIAAKPNNDIGVAGMNWNISLIPIRFIGSNGGGSTEAAIRAFDYAAARGAQIINASWGGRSNSALLKETIARCRDKGILLIAAAGNEAVDNDLTPTYPAGFELDNIISVAAVDLHGDLSTFSNWGKKTVHIAAPGESILSTITGKKYGYSSGTSMATPHITGAAALIWSQNPSWTYKEVRDALLQNCIPTPELKDAVQCGGFFQFRN
ncbi:S8 family peptidase [Bdellovibrio sp.]|uniref:S8 family peptidase n=1 Tax=Bdellovibrio sp. TaxID=28201 RepID=UPI0039E5961A